MASDKKEKIGLIEARNGFFNKYTFFTDGVTSERFIAYDNGRVEPFELKQIKNLVYQYFYDEYQCDGQHVESLSALAENMCKEKIIGTHLRVASPLLDGKKSIMYRLNDEDVISITPNNISIMPKAETGIMFRDDTSHRPNSPPEKTDIPLDKLLLECDPLLGDNSLFYTTAMISAFLPDVVTPLVNIYGDHGGFKTGTCSLYEYIIDPRTDSFVIGGDSLPKDHDKLVMKLINGLVTHFDNITKITGDQSDTFARAVTGGYEQKRDLYYTSRTIRVLIATGLIINGITNSLFRADILDRTVNVEMSRIENFISESAVAERIDSLRGKILYSIAEMIQKWLLYDGGDINPINNRMTDYTTLTYFVGQELGYTEEEVTEKFNQNTLINLKTVGDNSPILSWIYEHLSDEYVFTGKMEKLHQQVMASGTQTYKTSASLGTALKKMYKPLYDFGFMITQKNTRTNIFSIRKREEDEPYSNMGVVKD